MSMYSWSNGYVFKETTASFLPRMGRKKRRFNHVQRRANAKKRNLGYVPLFDNPFPKCDVRSIDMHHVNCIIVVPLPHRTHKKMIDHDTYCKKWIKKLFLLDIDLLLCPEISTVPQASRSAPDLDYDQRRDYETVCFDSALLFSSDCRENVLDARDINSE